MTVQRGRCTACDRIVYALGQARIIEAARTNDGREPVEEFLAELEASTKRKDIDRLADVAMLLEDYARGDLVRPRELNHLRNELWEIKPGDVRLPFYEADDPRHSVSVVRVTSGFLKTQLLTQHRHINWGLRVAREDKELTDRERGEVNESL